MVSNVFWNLWQWKNVYYQEIWRRNFNKQQQEQTHRELNILCNIVKRLKILDTSLMLEWSKGFWPPQLNP